MQTQATGAGSGSSCAILGRCSILALAIAAGAGCAGREGGIEAAGILNVDDSDFQGALGDDRLSLREAIDLATGSLAVDRLGRSEKARVSGQPGAESRDLIRFEHGLRIFVARRAEPAFALLPIVSAPGDEIDGTGATIDGSRLGMEPQASPQEVLWITDTEYGPRSIASLFTVTASDIRIHDLAIENVPGAAFVVVGGAGDGVTGVEIVRTTVQGLGRNSFSDGIILLGCSNSEGGFLSDVLIEENVLRDVHAGVVAFAGNALGRGQSARRCRLERLTIAENRIERPLTGIIAYAAQASLEAAAEENRLAEVGIVDNVIDAPLDVGILLSSTQPFAAATNARNRIESVRIAGNAISSPVDLDRGNTGLFLTGGQTFAGGASVEDAVTNLLIEDNRVEGVATAVLLVAGDAERCGPCETRASTLDGVTMRRNTWHARATGVLVAGGASFEAAGLVSGNRLGNVVLEDEEIEAGLVGVLVAGGVAASLPLGGNFLASGVRFPGYQEPGEITDSRVVGFALRRSTIRALDAVVLQGGSVTATEDTVRASGVERISLEDNLIEGERSHVAAFGGVVVDAGRVEGCAITSLVEAANRSQAGEAVTALIVQEVASGAAPQSSVVGNRVVP